MCKVVEEYAKEYAKEFGPPEVVYASSVHPLTVFAGEQIARHFKVCLGINLHLLRPTKLCHQQHGSNEKDAKNSFFHSAVPPHSSAGQPMAVVVSPFRMGLFSL